MKEQFTGKNEKLSSRHLAVSAIAIFGLSLGFLLTGPALAQSSDNETRTVVRLSPQIRESALGSGVPAIPRATIEKFLTRNRIIDAEEYQTAPYILASTSGNLVIGAGDEVYLRGDWSDSVSSYDIFRPGTIYTDPLNKESLGLEAVHLGTVNLVADAGDGIRTGIIRNNVRELKAGDRLLVRENENLQHTFYPLAPDSEISGQVIGLPGDKRMAAQYDAVVVNLGERDGLKVGDVLTIYESGAIIKDSTTNANTTLPGKETGTVLVYRSFEKLSYALILSSIQPTSMNFLVRAQ
jgi:hypothetical protein